MRSAIYNVGLAECCDVSYSILPVLSILGQSFWADSLYEISLIISRRKASVSSAVSRCFSARLSV